METGKFSKTEKEIESSAAGKMDGKMGMGTDVIANLEQTHASIRKMSSRDFRRRKKRIGWLEKLRDQLEKEAGIGWYVVVCEDEERRLDGVLPGKEKGKGRENGEVGVVQNGESTNGVRRDIEGSGGRENSMPPTPTSPGISMNMLEGVKKFWRRRSERSLKGCGGSSKSR